jgi:MFS family permease
MAQTIHPRRHLSRLVPRSQNALLIAVVSVSVVDSVLLGYDSSLMGSLNVMPTYQNYFTLTTATKSLNTAISYVGGSCAALIAGFVVAWIGRWKTIMLSCVLTLIGPIIQTAAQNIGMFIAGRFIVGEPSSTWPQPVLQTLTVIQASGLDSPKLHVQPTWPRRPLQSTERWRWVSTTLVGVSARLLHLVSATR